MLAPGIFCKRVVCIQNEGHAFDNENDWLYFKVDSVVLITVTDGQVQMHRPQSLLFIPSLMSLGIVDTTKKTQTNRGYLKCAIYIQF